MELRSIIESLLFASPKGLSPGDIKDILKATAEHAEEAWVQKLAVTRERAIESEIKKLSAEYDELERTYQLRCINGKWQFHSSPEFSPWQQVLLGKRQRPPRLTQPALETLSIIAYRQPITRAGIEKIRGVSVDGVMGKLMERGLVEEAGKSDLPGKPSLFATTELFLEYFGLSTLAELPDAGKLKDISADPNVPLEAPPENLHAVSNPDEVKEWGIQDTIDLAPNEPSDIEEEVDDEDSHVDDDTEEDAEDQTIEYASKSGKVTPKNILIATEEEIKSLESDKGDIPQVDSQVQSDQPSTEDLKVPRMIKSLMRLPKLLMASSSEKSEEVRPAKSELSIDENVFDDEKKIQNIKVDKGIAGNIETETQSDQPSTEDSKVPRMIQSLMRLPKLLMASSSEIAGEEKIQKTEPSIKENISSDEDDIIKILDDLEDKQELYLKSETKTDGGISVCKHTDDASPGDIDEAQTIDQPDQRSDNEALVNPSANISPSPGEDSREISQDENSSELIEENSPVLETDTKVETTLDTEPRLKDSSKDEPLPMTQSNVIDDPSNPFLIINQFTKTLWLTLNSIVKRLTNWIKKLSKH